MQINELKRNITLYYPFLKNSRTAETGSLSTPKTAEAFSAVADASGWQADFLLLTPSIFEELYCWEALEADFAQLSE